MKDKIIVVTAISFVIIMNYFVMSLTSVWSLLALTIPIYIAGYVFDSARAITSRIKFFTLLFVSLFVFHKILNMSLPWSDAVSRSAMTTLQIAILSQIIFLFARRASLSRLLQTLSFVPSKIRLLLTNTFSFIPVLLEEQEKISLVQKSRGLGANLKSKVFSPFAVLIPLVHRVFQRADAISTSILSRGYKM